LRRRARGLSEQGSWAGWSRRSPPVDPLPWRSTATRTTAPPLPPPPPTPRPHGLAPSLFPTHCPSSLSDAHLCMCASAAPAATTPPSARRSSPSSARNSMPPASVRICVPKHTRVLSTLLSQSISVWDASLVCRCASQGSARGAASPAGEQALLQEGHLLHVPLHFRRSVLVCSCHVWSTYA
jgi:hypothetical protein